MSTSKYVSVRSPYQCKQGHAYVEGSFRIVISKGSKCRECKICSRKKSRAGQQKCRYGITLEQKAAIFEGQGCRCACCGTDDPGIKGWSTDHIHGTKIVRGVLCNSCNLVLGKVKDSVQTLRAMIVYLEKHNGN